MQVTNALNNQIRILFNPNVEAFRLFDFLVVKSLEDRYLAQIIEIYDDKFDASQNVAKLKLFYKINPDNEVVPYDNFTPNKECEIVKIKQEEIEDFINADKKTFEFGSNVKNSSKFNLQYDFFNSNPIILADKVEVVNNISTKLAQNLSEEKHVAITDSTGILDIKGAVKISASKDFKMPLNFSTIDYIFDKCLEDATLEFQSIAGAIINEIKKFARKQENEFIPFNAFTRVILEQYKATPYPELKVLITKLKKFQMSEIFARTKKDKTNLVNTIKKNKITIIDLSNISSVWQKAYLEYITDVIEQDIYLLVRLNDENCDVDIINKIYCKKQNISLVPNVSYNYKKLPTISQYCKNYMLLSSLNHRTDFLNANFALNSLINENCLIFGENTDDFLFLVKDYAIENQDKNKKYRKIALSLVQNDEKMQEHLGEKGDYFENKQKQVNDSQKLIQELSDFNEMQENKVKTDDDFEDVVENNDEKIEPQEAENPSTDEFSDLSEYKDDKTEIKEELEKIEIEEKVDPKVVEDAFSKEIDSLEEEAQEQFLDETETELVKEEDELIAPTNEPIEEIKEVEKVEETITPEIVEEPTSEPESPQEKSHSDILLEETKDIVESPVEEETDDIKAQVEQVFDEPVDVEIEKTSPKNVILDMDVDNKPLDIAQDETVLEKPKVENQTIEEDDIVDLSDDELDFFQIAKESSEEYSASQNAQNEQTVENEKVVVDNVEYNTQNTVTDNIKKDELTIEENPQDDDIDLNVVAQNSLDDSFIDIINTKDEAPETSAEIPLNVDSVKQENQDNSLPIFQEKTDSTPTKLYKTGELVTHPKYGKGLVTKIVNYEERQLLQIDFDDFGKKLLDPTIANVKPLKE